VDDETLNLNEAAELVGITPSSVRYWIFSGKLPATKLLGEWRIQRSDLLKANEQALAATTAGKRGARGRFVPNSP
jgi:excisionase family DNA binding protein